MRAVGSGKVGQARYGSVDVFTASSASSGVEFGVEAGEWKLHSDGEPVLTMFGSFSASEGFGVPLSHANCDCDGGGGNGVCERGIDITTNSSSQSAQPHEISVSFSKDTFYANGPQTTATVRFKLISGGSPAPETINLQLVLGYPIFDVVAISDGGVNSANPADEPRIDWSGITAEYGVEYVRTVVFSQNSSHVPIGDSQVNKVYVRAPLFPPPQDLFGDCSHVATVVDCPV